MDTARKKDFLIKTAYLFTVLALVYIVYKFLVIYFFPFAIGLVLSYIIQSPSEKFSKRLKLKKGNVAAVSVAVCYVLLIAALIIVISWILSGISSASGFITDIISSFENFFSEFVKKLPKPIAELLGNTENLYTSFSRILADSLPAVSGKFAEIVPSFLFSSVITVVASFYIARDFDAVKDYIFSLLPKEKIPVIKKSADIININVFKLIKGYFLLALITFFILFAGFLILGFNNSAYLAAIISLVDFLPVLGTGTVLIPWSLAEFVLGNYTLGTEIAVLYLVDVAVRNFAEPKIVGKQLGIPPLVLLIIIFIGIKIFGFFGMLLSVISLVVVVELYKQGLIEL